MPPPPKFVYRFREKRAAKVFRHCNAEQLPAANYNIHTARKLGVNLQGVKHARQKYYAARVFARTAEHLRNQYICAVGYNHFFEKTPHYALQGKGGTVVVKRVPLVKIIGKQIVPAYRTLHYLREKA